MHASRLGRPQRIHQQRQQQQSHDRRYIVGAAIERFTQESIRSKRRQIRHRFIAQLLTLIFGHGVRHILELDVLWLQSKIHCWIVVAVVVVVGKNRVQPHGAP